MPLTFVSSRVTKTGDSTTTHDHPDSVADDNTSMPVHSRISPK